MVSKSGIKVSKIYGILKEEAEKMNKIEEEVNNFKKKI